MPIAYRFARMLAAALAAAFVCNFALTGCSQSMFPAEPASEEDAGPTSRSFMASMNEAADTLQEKMGAFTDAVARQDLVSMRVQADAAYAIIDDMAAIEAPDELKDLQQKYIDGCGELKNALNGFMELYTEIDSATTRNPFDYSTYADRMAQLQGQYDAAVQALQEADQSATEM